MARTPQHPENAFHQHFPLVRLGEFDLAGVLYHANYFHLLETMREEMLRAAGRPYREFVAKGQHLPITESHQEFLAPILYGKPIDIWLWVSDLKRASFKMNYEICYSGSSDLLHAAWTKHAFVQTEQGAMKLRPIPDEMLAALKGHAGSV